MISSNWPKLYSIIAREKLLLLRERNYENDDEWDEQVQK